MRSNTWRCTSRLVQRFEDLAGGYDEFERTELAMEQLLEMNRRNLGSFTFSLQSYSRDSLVMILAVDESGCEKARVVLRPHGSSEAISTEG